MNLNMKSLNWERIFKKGNLGKCLEANKVIIKINLSLGLPSGFLLPSGVECGAIFKVTWDQHSKMSTRWQRTLFICKPTGNNSPTTFFP